MKGGARGWLGTILFLRRPKSLHAPTLNMASEIGNNPVILFPEVPMGDWRGKMFPRRGRNFGMGRQNAPLSIVEKKKMGDKKKKKKKKKKTKKKKDKGKGVKGVSLSSAGEKGRNQREGENRVIN